MTIFRTVIRAPAVGSSARGQRALERKLLRVLPRVADLTANDARNDLRQEMASANLGRLAGAIGVGSDLKKRRIHRTSNGFSASGWLYIRGRSERTRGAIEAYTEGAEIRPTKGWLWIATPEIPRFVNRRRMTPALYVANGFESKIGPLVGIPGRHAGERLLIVKNVTVDRFGRGGKARRLPKRGAIGASRERRDEIVAFVGIRRTNRTARVNPRAIVRNAVRRMPGHLRNELKGNR